MGNIPSVVRTGTTPVQLSDTVPHHSEQDRSASKQAAALDAVPAAAHSPRRASHGAWHGLVNQMSRGRLGKKAPGKPDLPEFRGSRTDVYNLRSKFADPTWTNGIHNKAFATGLPYLFHMRAPALAPDLVADIKVMTKLLDAGASKQQVSEANKQFDAIYEGVFGKTKFADKKTASSMREFSLELERRISSQAVSKYQPVARPTEHLADTAEAAQPTAAELETIQRQFRFAESLSLVPVQAEQPVVYTETAPEPANPQNQYAGTSAPQAANKRQAFRDKARAAFESNPLGQDLIEAAGHLSEFGRHLTRKAMPQPSSSETGPVWKKYGDLIPNAGGGDCLFHALNSTDRSPKGADLFSKGADLSPEEILVVRENIANIKRNDPDTQQGMNLNANQLVAGLSQTPEYRSSAIAMMAGRHAIPNNVYADFQAIPGTYAGEDELNQWTALDENRGKTVVVIDEDGTYAMFKNRKRTPIPAEQLDHHVDTANIVLYKTALHWARIRKPNT